MTNDYKSWFQGTKLRFDPDTEGNKIVDGRMVLGMRAGPVRNDPLTLLHEMAHFIEIDDARCTVDGWGLQVPYLSIPPYAPCKNPQTFQAAAREIRVSAIQRVLAHHFGFEFDDYYGAKLIWDWVPGANFICTVFPEVPCFSAFERDDPNQPSYREMVKLRCDRIAQAIADKAKKWTIDEIRAEWNRKCQIHEERMP